MDITPEVELVDLRKRVQEKLRIINNNKEAIISAFIAETGCKPSECEYVEQYYADGSIKFYVQKREVEERIIGSYYQYVGNGKFKLVTETPLKLNLSALEKLKGIKE